MKIITAADKGFESHFLKMLESVKKLNYDIDVYDLGDLNYGEKYLASVSSKSYKKNPNKPQYILKKLKEIKPNELLVWMDADTVLVDRIDELEKDFDFDIGVTVRREKKKDVQAGRINSGIIFFRNNKNTLLFFEEWNQKTQELEGDQWALNVIYEEKSKPFVIKEFPCEIYNNYYFDETSKKAKILHYKTDKRRRYIR